MFLEILKYTFLLIFIATAAIGIASIPDWIKIPEEYRKTIFKVLILEVVGVLIILFNQEFINKKDLDISISNENWIALNDSGRIIHPVVTASLLENSSTKTFGKESYIQFANLKANITQAGLSIKNFLGNTLGTIDKEELKKHGIFNCFNTAKEEISSSENSAYVRWEKAHKERWEQSGSFLDPFELKVADYAKGTYYIIRHKDDKKKVVFDSRKSSKNLFSVDNRIIHFFEHNHVYYLLRIARADLGQKNNYVEVLNVRMEPNLKVK